METKPTKVPRAYTYADAERTKYEEFDFQGEWLSHIGKPAKKGVWFVYGQSGQGKTSYSLKLAKYFTQFGRVLYNTLEQGNSKAFKMAMDRVNMGAVGSKFTFVSESYDALTERLKRKRMPRIIIIDSLQYFFRGRAETDCYKLLETFPNTLFIFISHATTSNDPKGTIAQDMKYHADVKVFIEKFTAITNGKRATSRFGGGEPYIISKEKHEQASLQLVKYG